MAFDKRAYCMKLLAELKGELAKANQAREGYEQKVETWDLAKQHLELHVEAVEEYMDHLDHDDD